MIICLAISIICWIKSMTNDSKPLGLLSIVFMLLIILLPIIQLGFAPITYDTYEMPIYSIDDQLGIDGHFSMGCGNINSKMYYTFYEKNGSRFIPQTLMADKGCTIAGVSYLLPLKTGLRDRTDAEQKE